jgi:hypothetical protein
MNRALRYAGQAVVYVLFALGLGYFSDSPSYTPINPGQALIKLSFVHAGARLHECRQRTQAELDALAPNMRRPLDCPRERVPLRVRLELDGHLLCDDELPPAGLAGDGSAAAYRKFVVTAGSHRLAVRMRDSPRVEGYDSELETTIELDAGQHLVIDFDRESRQFRLF